MTKFILSIDGGGIRGTIPAAVLTVLKQKLEKRDKRLPLHRYFHMIAGTSTGAIIAAGLACPKPGKAKEAAADPETLLALYKTKGAQIFDIGLFRKLANFGGLFEERYDAQALETILRQMLGEKTEIRDALTKILITAYDIHARRAVFMTNADQDNARFLAWQAVRGSSAAPTYFEPALVEDLARESHGQIPAIPLIDGGVFANDPAMAAYVEGSKLGWRDNGDKIVILSLGTGSANRKIPYQQAKSWGAGGWINPANDTPLISVLMQGQSSTTSYQLNKLLNSEPPRFADGATVVTTDNRKSLDYFRLDAPLVGVNDALDDATPDNIAKLERFGLTLAEKHDLALEEIADRLSAI
ncbi:MULTISPECIES: patatin-like phospholipase family protein [Rhizobium]|uniref:Patatin n=1 Tax=Rhizobium wuzhouense TaxID=1986026 RepID=A0ABX5NSY9_9HYPH|nr:MULTISPECIES: patatin-like phospholipase family protein [Rhizobium]PYB73114.1 patatin [Rhizobium wuzhouense]RKE83802.1 patatin-like phospholipase/acyl hydrolase [Rhizobium sp. AG855]